MWRLPWPLLLAFKEDELLKDLLFGKKKDLEEGRAYLMKEKKPEKALAAFQQAVDAGWRPMYITRQHPNHIDRKSTRLNSSHLGISYAVFCLKKKKKNSIYSPVTVNIRSVIYT